MAILELQFPQRPRERTKHIKESYKCRTDTAWNDLLDVWAWKPEAQARNKFHAFFMRGTEREKQYKNMQEGNPHIGELIKEVVARKGIRTSWFAEQLGCHRNNIYLIYSRPWIDTETLMKISRILEHNFFDDLSKWY